MIKVLIRTKLPKEDQKIIIEIQDIKEEDKLEKIKEILLLDLDPKEYLQEITKIINK
jgi:hypothetical protein